MGSKTTGGFFVALAFAFLSFSGLTLYGSAEQQATEAAAPEVKPPTGGLTSGAAAGTNEFSLITEPQDGMVPVEKLIEGASSSIDLVMYEFEDTQLEQLLAAEAKKGITVRVILDNSYFGAGSSANEKAFDYLRTDGVQVHWSPAYFALTHEKSLVVDGKEALIMTLNFSPQYYKSDRDFGVVDGDANDVAAIEAAFDADWNGQNIPASNGETLVWSPNSRPQLLSLIASATSSLDMYNEEMEDPQTLSALEQAAERGVNVEVDMTYADNWKSAFQELSAAGVHVRTYAANAPLYIHAKVIIADDVDAFVGSENFSATSLDQNRELGLILSDPSLVEQLAKTFAQDWQGASPFLASSATGD